MCARLGTMAPGSGSSPWCLEAVLPPAPSTCPISFQIARLEQTWMVLRQRHTEGAILYEKKLKPFLKSLNEGKGNRSNCPYLTCFLLPTFVWAWHH